MSKPFEYQKTDYVTQDNEGLDKGVNMEHMSADQVDFLLEQPGVTWGFETIETPGPIVSVFLHKDRKGATVAYLDGPVEALANVVPLRTGKQARERQT